MADPADPLSTTAVGVVVSSSAAAAAAAAGNSQAASVAGNRESNMSGSMTHLQDFERRLIETDTYLQMLIEQIKGLDERISQASVEQEKASLVDVKAKTLVLLESVKHTIVLLQIAKVCACASCPVAAVHAALSCRRISLLTLIASRLSLSSKSDQSDFCQCKWSTHKHVDACRC